MKPGFGQTIQSQANLNVLSGSLRDIEDYWDVYDVLPSTQGANLAARINNIDILEYLHQHGVNANFQGARAAAEKGYIDVVRFLIDLDVGMLGVSDAAMSGGHTDIVELLVERCGLFPTRRGLLLAKRNGLDPVAHSVAKKYGLKVPLNIPNKTNVVFKEW